MIEIVNKIKKHIDFSKAGSCTAFAYLFSKYLVYEKKDKKAFIVEGYIIKNQKQLTHTWVILENKIIDPTFIQFKIKKRNVKRIEKMRYSPIKYINLEKNFIFYTDILIDSK